MKCSECGSELVKYGDIYLCIKCIAEKWKKCPLDEITVQEKIG